MIHNESQPSSAALTGYVKSRSFANRPYTCECGCRIPAGCFIDTHGEDLVIPMSVYNKLPLYAGRKVRITIEVEPKP